LLAFHGDEKVSDEIVRRNLVQFRTGAEEEPTRKWKLKQQFESFWLATSNDNFYASSGAISVATAYPRRGGRHIGNELDLVAEYQLDKELSFDSVMHACSPDNFPTPQRRVTMTTIHTRTSNTTFRNPGFQSPITPNRRN